MKSISQTLSGMKSMGIGLTFEVVRTYECPSCGSSVSVLKANIQGSNKLIDRCKTCEENRLADETIEFIEQKKKEKLLKIFEVESLINPDLSVKGFKDYLPRHDSQQEALEAVTEYVKHFSADHPQNLLLQGSYGLGKSHLAVGVTKNLMHKGYSCIFVTAPKLLTKLKSTFNKKSEFTEDQMLTALEKIDCLVLDDMGAEALKKSDDGESWALQKLFEIIDSRQGKHTIYTTNLNGKELLQKYNQRNVSRMMKDTKVIKIEGDDYRMTEF